MHVRWDAGAASTPLGKLVFFAEFLAAPDVFERWVSACPLGFRLEMLRSESEMLQSRTNIGD